MLVELNVTFLFVFLFRVRSLEVLTDTVTVGILKMSRLITLCHPLLHKIIFPGLLTSYKTQRCHKVYISFRNQYINRRNKIKNQSITRPVSHGMLTYGSLCDSSFADDDDDDDDILIVLVIALST